MNARRIFAIIGLCGWGVLIACTVIFAFINTDESRYVLTRLIAADIIVPVGIWIFMVIIKRFTKDKERQIGMPEDDNDSESGK